MIKEVCEKFLKELKWKYLDFVFDRVCGLVGISVFFKEIDDGFVIVELEYKIYVVGFKNVWV